MSILVFNAGSASLKFALFDEKTLAVLGNGCIGKGASGSTSKTFLKTADGREFQHQRPVSNNRAAVFEALSILVRSKLLTRQFAEVSRVGHRVVHGGSKFRRCTIINDSVKAAIAQLSPLAPLHNPAALETIEASQERLPSAQHAAMFDTSFFADLPARAQVYPLPYEWFRDWGIRKFGFHGISHQYCLARAREMLEKRPLRLIVCHLGQGCSATALRNGKPMATSMGFTPLEGMMMGTRAGSIDPGIIFYLLRSRGLEAKALDAWLNRGSGLLGVSGISGDFREVERAALRGNRRARLALEIYEERIRQTIGAFAATLGGVNAIVFTGGVGEHRPGLRESVCHGLQHLGIKIDKQRNRGCQRDRDVSSPASSTRVLVIHTEEELMIAKENKRLTSGE